MKTTHKRAWLYLLLVIAVLTLASVACGDDWDGVDRSEWAWDGSDGDVPPMWDEVMGGPPEVDRED